MIKIFKPLVSIAFVAIAYAGQAQTINYTKPYDGCGGGRTLELSDGSNTETCAQGRYLGHTAYYVVYVYDGNCVTTKGIDNMTGDSKCFGEKPVSVSGNNIITESGEVYTIRGRKIERK